MDASGYSGEKEVPSVDRESEELPQLCIALCCVLGAAAVAFALWFLHRFYHSLMGVPHA